MGVLTRTGRGVLALGLAAAATGWVLGYGPLLAVGAALLVAVVVAVLLVARPPAIAVERTVHPTRVLSGRDATVELRITNVGRRPVRAGVGLERFGTDALPIAIPPLGIGATASVVHPLPTARRGVFDVGPLVLNRSDPLALARRGQWSHDVDRLYVHPRLHEVEAFPSGLARDLDGPNSGEAPEGGVAFQNVREYVVGDDRRLIHWPSSAKTGQLMVRHNVDSHQPRSLILFDTRRSMYSPATFEEAVRVTASIATASLTRRFPFKLRTTAGRVIEKTTATSLLDELAAMTVDEGDFAELTRRASQELGGFSLAVVTGRAPADDLVNIGPLRTRFEHITIIRAGIRNVNEVVELPGAVLLNVQTSTEFAVAWNRRIRR